MSLSLSHTHTHIHTHTYTSLSFGLGVASWSIWFPNLGKNRMDNPSGSKENGKQINTYSTVNQRVHTPVHARTQAHTRTRTHAHTQRIREIVFINGIVAPPGDMPCKSEEGIWGRIAQMIRTICDIRTNTLLMTTLTGDVLVPTISFCLPAHKSQPLSRHAAHSDEWIERD